MQLRSSTTSDPASRLLEAILAASDRDHSPGARELVAYREGDDPDYLKLLKERASRIVTLSRFGRPLLSVAEFPPTRSPRAERQAAWLGRWRSARPIVLPGWAARLVNRENASIAEIADVLRDLRRPRTLKRFLEKRMLEIEPARLQDDPERDLEKYFVGDRGESVRTWIKSATLTSPTTNLSGRIRFSFGVEGDDDASPDRMALARVSQMARKCMPFADALAKSKSHMGLLERFIGSKVLLTQHIAYWNSPEGGALLHHDSFHEPARTRQRGVCYVQQSGATVWLALCTADLVRHTSEFMSALDQGAAPWIVDEHFAGRRTFARISRRSRDRKWLAAELTSPGCGAFASFLNYSPEFIGTLADAGHMWLLEPGDAILLPNVGLHRTALHAVWCAGGKPGAALSMAIRGAR